MTVFGITISMVLVWLAVAIIMVVIEAITVGLTTIWFAAGAIIAMGLAALKLGIGLQIILFLVVSLCLLCFTRKFFVEKLKTGSEKTNAEALIGQKAQVAETIKPHSVGQVKIGGQMWSAVCENAEEEIEKGALVTVKEIQGVKLIVNREE